MKCRKKPIVVEAIRYTGTDESKIRVSKFCERKYTYVDKDESFVIPTLEGDMKASIGDYIIKGVNGEVYPCKPDIFEKTYEVVG